MAAAPRSIKVQVSVEVNEEAVAKLAAAQERFNAALAELQASISDVQMATYEVHDLIATTESVSAEPNG